MYSPTPRSPRYSFCEHHTAVAVDASFAQIQVNLLAASCLFQESNSTMILRRMVACFSSDGQNGQRCSAAALVFSLPARYRILWYCRALNWTVQLLRARGQREDHGLQCIMHGNVWQPPNSGGAESECSLLKGRAYRLDKYQTFEEIRACVSDEQGHQTSLAVT